MMGEHTLLCCNIASPDLVSCGNSWTDGLFYVSGCAETYLVAREN